MKKIKLNCGWYEHDDGEFKPCCGILENRISKIEDCFLVPVINNEIDTDYIGFSLNAEYKKNGTLFFKCRTRFRKMGKRRTF